MHLMQLSCFSRVVMYFAPHAHVNTSVADGFSIHLPSFWKVFREGA